MVTRKLRSYIKDENWLGSEPDWTLAAIRYAKLLVTSKIGVSLR
jgi:hypothetical protein